MSLQGKKIFIFQQRNWGRTIGHFLAKKLTAEGCVLAAWTMKPSTHKFTKNQKDVKYEFLINDDEALNDPVRYLSHEDYSLQEICEALGVPGVWPMASTIRNYVKSYREKFYYSFRQNVPDEQIVAYIKAVYKYLKRVFEEFQPDLILAPNFVVLPHIMFNLYGQKRGIPMLAVTDSKVQGINIFTYSYRDDKGPFFERVDALNQNLDETINRERAKKYIAEFRQSFKHPDHTELPVSRGSIWRIVRHELSPFYQILKWYWKRPENELPALGPTLDFRPPGIILRDHFARKRYQKFAEKFSYHPIEKSEKYVYFPLQFQPEAAIDVIAPFFNNQIETARLVAMSLPADYTLVVKEHPSMVGLRPPSYLEKIARSPNVKLVDYRIPSEEILRKARLVVNLGNTILAEAALYKIPGIQLGDLGVTLKLPNVWKHTDMTSLSKKIQEVLEVDLNTADYERRLENFVAAAFDAGFDFKYFEVWAKGGDMNILWQIYKKEIEKVLV